MSGRGNVCVHSRVAQRERARPITQRSMDRNHPLLEAVTFPPEETLGRREFIKKICLVYILFGEVSVEIFGPFFKHMKSIYLEKNAN